MEITLGDNQQTTIHLHGLDAAGLAGSFVKAPLWAVDDPTIATITPDADGTNAVLASAVPAKLGTTRLTVTDEDDPDVAVLSFDVIVTGEKVTSLGVTVDPPTEKDVPAVNPNP